MLFCQKCNFSNISVILCFSVGTLLFLFFFFWQLFQPSLNRLAPNLARICSHAYDLNRRGWFLKVLKPGHNSQKKKTEKLFFFHPDHHIFAHDEMDKVFLNIFSMILSRVLNLSENILWWFQTVWFSQTLLNGGRSKKTDFDGYYIKKKRMRYDQSLYGVLIVNTCILIRGIARIWHRVTFITKIQGVQISDLCCVATCHKFCRYGPVTTTINFVQIGWKTTSLKNCFELLLKPSLFCHLLANSVHIKLCCVDIHGLTKRLCFIFMYFIEIGWTSVSRCRPICL